MLTTEELEAILRSMLDVINDDPKPDWRASLYDAAALIAEHLDEQAKGEE